jgi:Fic family protein
MWDSSQAAKYIYNSNRLDGVHIAYDAVLDLVENPPDPLADSVDIPAMAGAGEKTYFRHHVTSHHDALEHLQTLVAEAPYTEQHILDLHHRLMDGVILSSGEYRECTLRYRMIPPVAADQIPTRMRRVLAIMNLGFDRAPDKGILAWQVHHEFIYVHPFIEGNGRLARLLLNLTRLRAGLPLEVIPFGEHQRYLRSIMAYGQKLQSVTGGPAPRATSQSGRLLQPPG